ncbi:MAG: hypothetical protein AAF480_15745 [Actinomycetota bacterium]
MIEIYAPDGRVRTERDDLAQPVLQLAGKRLGILDNTKPNAGVLLHRMAEHLRERGGSDLAVVETKNAALAAPDQVIGRLTKEVELVLTGSAD